MQFPVPRGKLLKGDVVKPAWGARGKERWHCLCLRYFELARLDEVFASGSGVVHAARC